MDERLKEMLAIQKANLTAIGQEQLERLLVKHDELPADIRRLLDAADKAKEFAYNPYSHFYVGSAVLTQRGDIFAAANLENASYGLTLCAERSAITKANSEGQRMFEGLAIVTRGEDFDTSEPSMSCGACRQWIYEFAQISERDLWIVSSNTDRSRVIITPISEMLNCAFGPADLGIDVDRYRIG
jgi:cytidine deaminase